MFKLYTKWLKDPKDAHFEGRKLALEVASDILGYIPEIRIGENGKPYIDGVHFNISHSHNLVVCAFGDCELGVDVEKTRDFRARVAERFHPAEKKHLEKAEDKDVEFFRIWTMKEAYLKCLGVGISKDLSSFNVFDIPNMHTTIQDGYIISICEK